MKAPCKNCQKRELGCHSNCQDYEDWKDWVLYVKLFSRKEQALTGFDSRKQKAIQP